MMPQRSTQDFSIDEVSLALLTQITGEWDIRPEWLTDQLLLIHFKQVVAGGQDSESVIRAISRRIRQLQRKFYLAKLKEVLGPERPYIGDLNSYLSPLRGYLSNGEELVRKMAFENLLYLYNLDQVPSGKRFLYPSSLDGESVLKWNETLEGKQTELGTILSEYGQTPETLGERLRQVLLAEKKRESVTREGVIVKFSSSNSQLSDCPFPHCPHHDPRQNSYDFDKVAFKMTDKNCTVESHGILWHMLSRHGLCVSVSPYEIRWIDPAHLVQLIF